VIIPSDRRQMFGRTLKVSAVLVCLALLVAALPSASMANSAGSAGAVAHASSCPATAGTMSRDAAFVRNTYSYFTGLRTTISGAYPGYISHTCTWFRVIFYAGSGSNPRRCSIRYDAYWKGGSRRVINNYFTYRSPANSSCPYNRNVAFEAFSDVHL
jgi:hypothetical protein